MQMLSERKERNATPNRKAGADGWAQKKARYESGLNLSLEENRGDMSIMLHRKK
jgi:hypothetical protein